ncbi:MAG: ankyrin repeat domain-containing protein [Proteobacteria bacterium]|nr:ankyrin repeat domain-containing protein [Pseudomonadota bacterium]
MSEHTPGPEEEAQLDALYQRLSRRQAEGPSEAMRRAILSGAREIARARREPSWQAWLVRLRDSCGRPAVFGTLAAGIVAALLLVPLRQLPMDAPELALPQEVAVDIRAQSAPEVELKKSQVPADALLPVPVDKPTEHKPDDARVASAVLEETVVTRAAATTARAAPAPAAVPAPPPAPRVQGADGGRDLPGGMVSADSATNAAARRAAAPAVTATTTAAAGDPGVALRRAAAAGDPAQVVVLIRAHAPLDEPDAQGRTALMLAVMARDQESVRLLLDAGANPNTTDAGGLRPMDLAAGDPVILQLLRGHGAH